MRARALVSFYESVLYSSWLQMIQHLIQFAFRRISLHHRWCACIPVWATVFDRATHRYNLSTVRHTRNCRWFTTADVFRHYYCDFVFCCCRCRCSCSPPNVWKYLWLIDLLNGWKRIYEILINVLNECARDMWWRQKRLSSLKVIEMPAATATFPTTVTLHTWQFLAKSVCSRTIGRDKD